MTMWFFDNVAEILLRGVKAEIPFNGTYPPLVRRDQGFTFYVTRINVTRDIVDKVAEETS